MANSPTGIFREHHTFLLNYLKAALAEDVGNGDHTSLACVSAEQQSEAYLECKDEGIWAGNEIVSLVLNEFFDGVDAQFNFADGDAIAKGDIVYELKGNTRSILTSERIILNLVQHLSGVATTTQKMSSLIADLHTQLLDTRKTTPGLRVLEKWAVTVGGAKNHRMGLFDMVMIKDNHIDQCGSITLAVDRVDKYFKASGFTLPIEVETRSLDDVEEVMALDLVQWLMLDNFSPEEITEALKIIDGKKTSEASGGINATNIRAYAMTGVDYISSGFITQGALPLDLSLKIKK